MEHGLAVDYMARFHGCIAEGRGTVITGGFPTRQVYPPEFTFYNQHPINF